MMSHKVKILDYSTFRLNLSCTSPYNADFDGDEMNLHVPQSIPAAHECAALMSVGNNLLSAAINAPTMGVVQDALLACWLLSGGRGPVFVERPLFYDTMLVASESCVPIPALLKPKARWSGTQVIDLAWPVDFHYDRKGVIITDGRLLSGVLTSKTLGRVSEGIIHAMHHSHGADATMGFLNKIQNVANFWMLHTGFSVGVHDCCPGDEEKVRIYDKVKSQIATNTIYPRSAEDEDVLYKNLNKARDVAAGAYLAALNVNKSNALVAMMTAGSKGSKINVAQISACVGQQSVNGKRIGFTRSGRTTAHFTRHSNSPIGRGFVANNYLNGLKPAEFWFHAAGGREGLIDTAVKTSQTGYLERQIVKRTENIMIEYDGTVRDRGQIVQFVYGGDGLDGSAVVDGKPYDDVGIAQTVRRLTRRNPTVDWAGWGERERAERAARAQVAPGEMVGCLAAQSISEPATQMTLNTFHLAGVGNTTTTTGIPRLQEIFHASSSQRTVLTIRATVDNWVDCHPAPRTLLSSTTTMTYSSVAPDSSWALRCWHLYWEHRGKIRKRNWVSFELDQGLNAYDTYFAVKAAFPRAVVLFTHSSDAVQAIAVGIGGKRALTPTEFRGCQRDMGSVIINKADRVDKFGTPTMKAHTLAFKLPHGVDPRLAFSLPDTDPLTARFSNPLIAARIFGVAHARDVIIAEVKAVLSVDGTFVDPRHVDLLADTMCVTGTIHPFTRHGLAKSGATPLSRASFETATRALVEAAAGRAVFKLNGVTERIITGQHAFIGTNARVELRLDEEKCTAAVDIYGAETVAETKAETKIAGEPPFSPFANFSSFTSPADLNAAWSPVCLPASPTYSPSAPTYCAGSEASLDFFSQALSHPTYS